MTPEARTREDIPRSLTTPSASAAGPPTSSPLPLLTVEDLASFLSLSARGAREILQRGELPGFRVGRRWYLRRENLDAAVADKVAGQRRDRDAAVRTLRGLPVARSAQESP